jgi:DNA mismatch repair ATPase MutS
MPQEKKNEIYYSYMKSNSKSAEETSAYLSSINLLTEYINLTKKNTALSTNLNRFSIDTQSSSVSIDETKIPNLEYFVNQVESLKLALRTCPLRFLFIS